MSSPGLVIVSNRLPVSVKKVNGTLEYFPSVGGLATGLASYADDSRNKWIGWPGIPNEELTEKDRHAIADELQKHNCYPVFLTKKQIDEFYNGYCNRLLWPLFHDIKIGKDAWALEDKYWKAYKKINELFAEVVLALSIEGSVIWVHDYQLLLLPSLLHTERPDDKVGFFLHIPFPAAKNFAKLRDGEAIVAGLLGAGLVGFHTKAYVENFIAAVEHYDLGITLPNNVLLSNRSVRVLDFPMGIDYQKYQRARKSDEVQAEFEKLREQYAGLKVILTVDRLDPSKGLVERAKAYQMLLAESPKLRGKITMLMVVVPSRTEIAEYKKLKEKLDAIISDINTTYGSDTWQPVVYRYESLPFHEVTALYRLADIAFIVPLRDGMNLVAKEYLASKIYRKGVLVLSETAGAAQELKEAVMVNPKKPETVVAGLKRALAMPKQEFQSRLNTMQTYIESSSVQNWAGGFMKSLRQNSQLYPSKLVTLSLSETMQNQIAGGFNYAEKPLLFLDYDGVLVNFHRNPATAAPSEHLKTLLVKLAEHASVVVISGRARGDLETWLGDIPVSLVAEHGMHTKRYGHKWHATPYDAPKYWQKIITPALEKYAAKAPGSFVEVKSASIVWHFRKTTPYYAQKYSIIIKQAFKKYARKSNLEIRQGNKIIEIRPKGINKGTSVIAWLNRVKTDFILVIGDDYTDEDMFTNLQGDAYTIKVGRGRTAAKFRLKNVDAVHRLLEKMTNSN